MTSRASYYRNTAKHSQRQGVPKPKLQERHSDTVWLGPWLLEIAGTGPFSVNSVIALPVGHTPQEREAALRKVSALGILSMTAHRENGVFVEYRWRLA